MSKLQVCWWIETWYKTHCPSCEETNWICNGDESDLSGVDVEAVQCRKCGIQYLLSEPVEGLDETPVRFEVGRGTEEL